MPKTEILHPDKKVSAGAYSAGVLIDGWLYISGQGPLLWFLHGAGGQSTEREYQ